MEKLDLTKKYKSYFTARQQPEVVQIKQANYLSITGKGDPSGEPFLKKIEALYPVAYTIKFDFKTKGNDFTVSKLEALWWFDEERYANLTMDNAPIEVPRSEWEYRLLIMLPDFVTRNDFEKAARLAFEKKKNILLNEVEFFTMDEGKCVQMLHVGPYSTEPDTLKQMLTFIAANNFERNGHHHEIYLSDFRKTPPEKLRTILREPVR